ncbi:MAG: type I methionyl aminopeptidase [Bacteroidota bacterium]
MSIESQQELQGIRAAGKAVAIALKKMREFARVGMSTKELDEYGFEILRSFGAVPAPKKDYGFPAYTCISLNDEVCHGIPSDQVRLKDGDLVNIDVSAELDGYYGDNGGSFVLGNDFRNLSPLVEASKEILRAAIRRIRSQMKVAELGGFIEAEAKKRGYRVIRNLCGHGIGRKLHEAPAEIPNFRDRRNQLLFKKNAVVAVETFISTKARYAYTQDDGWTMKTNDKSLVAQHEHTLIVTDDQPIILTEENGI